jgi:formylglycine-generating enzyme required for sulfatase activity
MRSTMRWPWSGRWSPGGFPPQHIIRLLDREATKARIEDVLGDALKEKVGRTDRVLVFFAGHGKTDRLCSNEEEGYLIPVDGDPSRLFSTAVSMTALRQISERLVAKHILYVVGSCYSGYALFNRAISDELLEEIVKKPAIQILTAGRQQDQAQERNGHGAFTEVLLRGLEGDAFAGKSWLSLEELGLWVKQRVFAESNKKQLPQYGNLSGEGQFVFVKGGVQAAKVDRPLPNPPLPAGEGGVGGPGPSAKAYDLPKQTGRELTGRDGAPMVLVPAGEFQYGENNQRLSLPAFYRDKYEVSTRLYSQFLQATSRKQPDDWSQQVALVGGGDRPVVKVTWHDADAYCRHYGKRLPTEQEWEKAARGTDGQKFPWGNEEPTSRHALFATKWNGYGTLALVGSHETGTSPYGIQDLAGNVWEWTSSDYDNSDQYTVIRGGSWSSATRTTCVLRSGAAETRRAGTAIRGFDARKTLARGPESESLMGSGPECAMRASRPIPGLSR